jgi:hypothetical protein
MSWLSRHNETGKSIRRSGIRGLDLVHTRTGRTAPDGHLEALHGVGIAFGHHLDATVMLIADVAQNALATGGVFDEEPETDPLDAPFHDIAAPDEHGRLYK